MRRAAAVRERSVKERPQLYSFYSRLMVAIIWRLRSVTADERKAVDSASMVQRETADNGVVANFCRYEKVR